jgi:hypothetical protein
MSVAINYWAILVSVIISVVLGFLWYGPFFGKKWMAYMGMTMPAEKPPFKTMLKPIILSLVGAIFMSVLTAIAIGMAKLSGPTTIWCGLLVAASNWLGFVVPPHFNSVGWEGKPWGLFFINVGYWLAYLVIIGAIIYSWA